MKLVWKNENSIYGNFYCTFTQHLLGLSGYIARTRNTEHTISSTISQPSHSHLTDAMIQTRRQTRSNSLTLQHIDAYFLVLRPMSL